MNNINTKISYSHFYPVFGVSAVCVLLLFQYDLLFSFAILIFVHQFLSLYFRLGKGIPIRSLIGMMFSINYLLAPVLMYTWLNPYTPEAFNMKGDPVDYFTYAIPAVIALIIALKLNSKDIDEEIDIERLKRISMAYPKLPLRLALLGLISMGIKEFLPSELQVVFTCISYFGFAGLFLSLFNGKKIDFLLLFLSFGILVIRSLTSSMFNDMLNMVFFLGFFLCVRYKPSHVVKIFGLVVGLGLVVFVQNIKPTLRGQVTNSLQDIENFSVVVRESQAAAGEKHFNERVSDVMSRLDQGWITAGTIENFKAGGFPLQEGKHSLTLVQSSVLPRILAPNKLQVGDMTSFNTYSGHYVAPGTSMALGILSDGFIDFGYYGILVVFVFGLIISEFLKLYSRWSKRYILAMVFCPLCFFYVVRPDNDTHNILGVLVKVSLVLWLTLMYLNKYYLIRNPKMREI